MCLFRIFCAECFKEITLEFFGLELAYDIGVGLLSAETEGINQDAAVAWAFIGVYFAIIFIADVNALRIKRSCHGGRVCHIEIISVKPFPVQF